MLTPVDIETVEFKKATFGYSREDVDTFLDRVIVEFEKLYKDNAKLQDKISAMEDALKYYKGLEDTIKDSIVTAEKNAEESKKNASISAQQIITAAEQQAQQILQDANTQLSVLKSQIVSTRAEYARIKGTLRSLLENQIQVLEANEAEFIDSEAAAAVEDNTAKED